MISSGGNERVRLVIGNTPSWFFARAVPAAGYPRIIKVFQRGGEIVGTRSGHDRVPEIDPHHEGQPESESYRMASDHVSRGTMRAARGNVA